MDYQREQNLIRAGFALHAWRLLKHYDTLTRDLHPSQRYEATLTVCVLQSLVTNCWELYKYLGRKSPQVLGAVDTFVESLLANPEVDVTNTFQGGDADAKTVLVHVRNALSHPRMRDTDPPTTGYTTVEDGSGLVARMRFVDSPDLNSKGNLRQEALERTGGDLQRAKVFAIELPLSRLTALAEELALVLAQPVVDNWDSAELVRPTLRPSSLQATDV